MRRIQLIASIILLCAFNSYAQCVISLPADTTLCEGEGLNLDISTQVEFFEDSLIITYDATLGTTGLAGAPKVYMHSTYELVPFGGPVIPWVGNWGLDDSLGLMDSIGPDLWQITLHLPSYYGFAPGTSINGLFMVFRNADGSLEGKDDLNNDIFLDLSGMDPSSGFSGITGDWKRDSISTILWSDGSDSLSILGDTPGTYWVEVTDTNGCTVRDSMEISYSFPAPSLGADTAICGTSIALTLDPGTFDLYAWSDLSTGPTLSVTSAGTYSVMVTDSAGCTESDTITISGSSFTVYLGTDITSCDGGALLEPTISLDYSGDSLTITYDATAGVTGLVGADTVYFHSTYELVPFGGPVTPWVGNWGMNDGLGLMDSIGTDLWQITIHVEDYYALAPGTSINGLFMVFRNADGTLEGKDDFDANIFLDLSGPSPVSAFGGITASLDYDAVESVLWSDGSSDTSLFAGSSGTYWIQVTDTAGCSISDSIEVSIGGFTIDLGPDTTVCGLPLSITLDAGPGYSTYSWSGGGSGQTKTVTSPGTYNVLAFDSLGCFARDTITISSAGFVLDLGADTIGCGDSLVLDPAVSLDMSGDSLTITYDATMGVTGLAGEDTVYFHSTYELVPFGGPVTPWVGNWGLNDGLGLMDSVGPDLWQITINLQDYYGLSSGMNVNGLFMVFRNADGSAEGKDDLDNEIFLDLSGVAPASGFGGISASWDKDELAFLSWQDGSSGETFTVTTPGTYWIEAQEEGGCLQRDSIMIGFSDPSVDIGPDTAVCSGSFILTIEADSGFSSYLWSTGSGASFITAITPGLYSVTVTDSVGCTASDARLIMTGSPVAIDLGPDTALCGDEFLIEPTGTVELHEDSLVITYDATAGVTGLAGSPKVYFHSGYELVPFGGAVAWVGNWGLDDGIGQMDSIGPDLWQITIEPYSYYGLAPGTGINGLFIVFRNADGSETGKDDLDNDIFLDLSGASPSSSFSGISAYWKKDAIDSWSWSDGSTGSSLLVDSSGTYSVVVTDSGGCTSTDSIEVTFLAIPEPDLGSDTTICPGPFTVTLDAGPGFSSYAWSTGASGSSISVSGFGVYSVTVTNAGGCSGSDDVGVYSGISAGSIDLGPDTVICGVGSILLDAGVTLSPDGDTLVITYDATQGVTGLVGSPKVYMHSGYQLSPGGGIVAWVGNWGMDDGLGQMTNIGTDLWEIRINPVDYYGYDPDSTLTEIHMVFRNADGTLEGKDWADTNIVLSTVSDPPSSVFSGVTASIIRSPFSSVLWSDGSTMPTLAVSAAGTFSVQATDTAGCIATDTIDVSISALPDVDLGPDTAFCVGGSITLDAGPGFTAYDWSDGTSTQTNSVTASGSLTVTVTDSVGCEGFDIINITVNPAPVADFSYTNLGSLEVAFSDLSSDGDSYQWDFTSDGTFDDFTTGGTSFIYPVAGVFTVTLVVTNDCGSDTSAQLIVVSEVGMEEEQLSNVLKVFPNPASDRVSIEIPTTSSNTSLIRLADLNGKVIWETNATNLMSGSTTTIQLPNLPNGLYFLELKQKEAVYRSKLDIRN